MIFLLLFITFFQIGLLGFGGGYSMLSMIQAVVVTRYGWMSTGEFADMVALSQMTPGPIGINSATYVGYTSVVNAGYPVWAGFLGSLLATFALVLPTFVIMIIISRFLLRYKSHPVVASIFRGIRPAVAALIATPVFRMAHTANINIYNVWIPIVAALGIWLLVFSPVYVILIAALGGYTYGQLIK